MKTEIMPYGFSSLILLPFCAGATIYSFSRIPIDPLTLPKHAIVTPSEWLAHCIPHGLWMLAALNGYQLIFSRHSFLKKWVWLTVMTSIAIIGQFAYSVTYEKNTYGIMNMLLYQYSFVLSVTILSIRDLKTIFY